MKKMSQKEQDNQDNVRKAIINFRKNLDSVVKQVGLSTIFQIFAILMGATSIASAIALNAISPFNMFQGLSISSNAVAEQRLAALEEKVAEQEKELKDIKVSLNELNSSINQTNGSDTSQVSEQTAKDLAELNSKVVDLESVILKDPVEALEIPLLKRDLESIKEIHSSDILALQQSIQQTTNFTIAILITMGISVLSMALGSALRNRSDDKKMSEQE